MDDKREQVQNKAASSRKAKIRRKKRNRILLSKTGKLIYKAGIPLLSILIITFLAAKLLGDIAFINITNGFEDYFSGMSDGSGYPLMTDEAEICETEINSGRLVLLTYGSTQIYNVTAKKTFSLQHTFSNPAMKINGGRIIVFDRNTNRFFIQSNSAEIYKSEAKGDILAAAMGKNGNYALCYRGEDAKSILQVYDKRNNKTFEWKCASELISDVSLSPDGKSVAVTAVSSKKAEIYSKLVIFDFVSKKPVSEFSYDETLLVSVCFTNSSTVRAIGTNMYVIISDKKTEKKNALSNSKIEKYSMDEEGNVLLSVSNFGKNNSHIIYIDSKGKTVMEMELKTHAEDIYCGRKSSYVLADNKIIRYDKTQKVIEQKDVDESVNSILVAGPNIYGISSGKIDRFKLDSAKG